MTDYTVLEHHADLGGIEAHPDLTEDLRPRNENSPSAGGNRLAEANVPTPRA